jgi:pyruvate-formate lyase-activating enzyme
MNVEVFGKQILVRDYHCQFLNKKPTKVNSPYANIYVRFDGCNANCKFCEYKSANPKFDKNKLIKIIKEFKGKLRINKINITGGEPTLNYDKFLEIFYLLKENLDNDTMIVINTNGLSIEKLFDNQDILNRVNHISLSRHHYENEKNDELFRTSTPTKELLKELNKENEILNLSCNLIKGYIDSKQEVYKYLEFASSIDVDYVGLVSLMSANDFCKDNLIDFKKIDLVSDRFSMIKRWKYEDICRCFNYLYIPEDANKVVRVYYKNTYHPDKIIEGSFVFDGKNLKVGFSDDVVY